MTIGSYGEAQSYISKDEPEIYKLSLNLTPVEEKEIAKAAKTKPSKGRLAGLKVRPQDVKTFIKSAGASILEGINRVIDTFKTGKWSKQLQARVKLEKELDRLDKAMIKISGIKFGQTDYLSALLDQTLHELIRDRLEVMDGLFLQDANLDKADPLVVKCESIIALANENIRQDESKMHALKEMQSKKKVFTRQLDEKLAKATKDKKDKQFLPPAITAYDKNYKNTPGEVAKAQ